MASKSSNTKAGISRRKLLGNGMVAIGGGAATFLAGGVSASQAGQQAAAPQQARAGGRRFRAFVRRGTVNAVEELRLIPIQPREVVIRTQAATVCYTIVGGLLSNRNSPRASVPNHSGMGVVEEVGALVKRVQVGDRVVIPGTPQCGQCYMCLTGRADWCQFLSTSPAHPFAEMMDGAPVTQDAGLGGLSEVMVVPEEYCCPVFTDLPAAELAMLGDTIGTGLAAGHNLISIDPGSDVVVLGAGPVGLGAIISARLASAGQIIAVEPISYRRDVALKMGATIALDPNKEGNGLVEKIRDLCKGPSNRRFAGGRSLGIDEFLTVPRGPDFTIEAVGGDSVVPKVEVGPDPTGILPIQQAYTFTRAGGHIVMLSFGQRGNLQFPASDFVNRGRTLHAGQQGGLHMLRDIPRWVKLMEKGTIDMKPIVTSTFPLERAQEAVQAVGDRTTVAAVVVFN